AELSALPRLAWNKDSMGAPTMLPPCAKAYVVRAVPPPFTASLLPGLGSRRSMAKAPPAPVPAGLKRTVPARAGDAQTKGIVKTSVRTAFLSIRRPPEMNWCNQRCAELQSGDQKALSSNFNNFSVFRCFNHWGNHEKSPTVKT